MAILSKLRKLLFPRDAVVSHWYVPIDNFSFGAQEFYNRIEIELESREVPGLSASHIELNEGGLLSDKRLYLRLQRERLIFDICSAPFGTSHFFSFRLIELPIRVKLFDMLILLIGLTVVFNALSTIMASMIALGSTVALSIILFFMMRNFVAWGLKNIDAILIKTPIIGPLYELLIRKETYYREDTRLMYLTTVESVTQAVVDEVTAAKGIELIKRYEKEMQNAAVYKPMERQVESQKPELTKSEPANG